MKSKTLVLVALGLAAGAGAQQPRAHGRLITDGLHSAALEQNRYGDSPNRSALVYLPPSYDSAPARRYPTVYLLHGYGGTERNWTGGYRGFDIAAAMDSLIGAGAINELIVVMPNARNRLGGSFYTNSEATGNWQDFIARELVTYIDGKYRTLARPASRGLAGHSMGGYGTLTIGMHDGGDVFGALYALSACCTRFARQLTADEEPIWRQLAELASVPEAQALSFYPRVFLAMSAAFSPNVNVPPLYVDLPFEEKDGRWRAVEPVQDEWSQHAPYDMIAGSAQRLRRLRGLAFDVGMQDELVSPAQLFAMDTALTRAGVVHHFETYDGHHSDRVGLRMTTKVLPFFSRVLDFTQPGR